MEEREITIEPGKDIDMEQHRLEIFRISTIQQQYEICLKTVIIDM